jgi:hypothetical protein
MGILTDIGEAVQHRWPCGSSAPSVGSYGHRTGKKEVG